MVSEADRRNPDSQTSLGAVLPSGSSGLVRRAAKALARKGGVRGLRCPPPEAFRPPARCADCGQRRTILPSLRDHSDACESRPLSDERRLNSLDRRRNPSILQGGTQKGDCSSNTSPIQNSAGSAVRKRLRMHRGLRGEIRGRSDSASCRKRFRIPAAQSARAVSTQPSTKHVALLPSYESGEGTRSAAPSGLRRRGGLHESIREAVWRRLMLRPSPRSSRK